MNLQRFCGPPRSRWTRWLADSTSTTALAYGAVIALLWWQQATPLFQPQTLPAEHRFDVEATCVKTGSPYQAPS